MLWESHHSRVIVLDAKWFMLNGAGWEGRGYGKGGVKRLNVVAVATSPLEAAGVTESGAFSQSDDDLASRGLTVHSTLEDLDLDQLNSLFAKVGSRKLWHSHGLGKRNGKWISRN